MSDEQAPNKTPKAAPAPVPAGPAADPNILLLTQTMAKMVEAMQSAMISKETIGEIMSPIVKEVGATVHQARWPENVTHPHISVFSYPEGDIARPKPKLARPTWFNGVREEEDRLTPSEIDGYNALKQPLSSRGGAWRAEIKLPKAMGGTEELYVWVPAASVDQRMQLPSLLLIQHELNTGQNTEDVLDLIKQVEALKKLVVKKGASANELEAALLGTP